MSSGRVIFPDAYQLRVSVDNLPASAIEEPLTMFHPQMSQLTNEPAAKAAKKPAMLFFSPKGGEGSLDVYLPKTRPKVEALVSASARIDIDAMATSRLNDATDMMAPRRYQMVELSFWRSLSLINVPTTDSYALANLPLPILVERSLNKSITRITSSVSVSKRSMYVIDT